MNKFLKRTSDEGHRKSYEKSLDPLNQPIPKFCKISKQSRLKVKAKDELSSKN